MSLNPRLTLIGLYNYNPAVFSNLSLPATVDEETFIDSLLMKYGECPLIYPNYDYMVLAIGAWSRKWYSNIERIANVLIAEYNPIYNYDRHEEWSGTNSQDTEGTESGQFSRADSDTRTKRINETKEQDIDENKTQHINEENKVSAYNEDEYQPNTLSETEITEDNTIETTEDNSTEISDGGTRNTSETQGKTTNESISGSDTKNGHIYGNVGVMQTQQMINDEIRLRTSNNIYNIITDLFYKEFCLYVF